jgi:hypothetical protein
VAPVRVVSTSRRPSPEPAGITFDHPLQRPTGAVTPHQVNVRSSSHGRCLRLVRETVSRMVVGAYVAGACLRRLCRRESDDAPASHDGAPNRRARALKFTPARDCDRRSQHRLIDHVRQPRIAGTRMIGRPAHRRHHADWGAVRRFHDNVIAHCAPRVQLELVIIDRIGCLAVSSRTSANIRQRSAEPSA